jgi:hypothetical protein
MSKRLELTGRVFGRLKVMAFAGVDEHSRTTNCEGECGNLKVVVGQDLTSGHTQSCDCRQRERVSETVKITNRIHGHNAQASFSYVPLMVKHDSTLH